MRGFTIKSMRFYADGLVATRDSVAGVGVRTTVARRTGDFLGFYSGRVYSLSEYERLAEKRTGFTEIAFEVSGTDGVVVRENEDDLIGYVNEPVRGSVANVVAIPLHLEWGNAVGYYAATHIPPGAELLVHYGRHAARDYPVGVAARAPRRIQAPDAVLPRATLECTRRYCVRRVSSRPRGKKNTFP